MVGYYEKKANNDLERWRYTEAQCVESEGPTNGVKSKIEQNECHGITGAMLKPMVALRILYCR